MALSDTVDIQESGVQPSGPNVRPVLPSRYEDLGEIAGGSFGEVRRVRDLVLDRTIAMKVLRAEYADHSPIRGRFLAEAEVVAQLQHPGIVALYDRGELADGRLWFTMKEIRGRTLGDVLTELHQAFTPNGFVATPSGWTFRRVVDAFVRITQAVAYAHHQGFVHRDLKPDNLMVGEFGEVLVMDWGLARRVGLTEAHDSSAPAGAFVETSAGLTQLGDILGTPAYMPPEQALGDTTQHGPWSDIYSLGAVLYQILTGKPPYDGTSSHEVLEKLVSIPPAPVREAASNDIFAPNELCVVCEKAMQRSIKMRYATAAALADDVVAWLDGVRRREQALETLQQARTYEPELAHLRENAKLLEMQARVLQNDIRPPDPIEKKLSMWQLEDEAKRLGRAAALVETKWLEAVHGSLSIDPSLPEAHEVLANHYRESLILAERDHREEDAARAEELLRIHDRGKHVAFLRGQGQVQLITNPAGAEVFLERYVLQNRRFVAVQERSLGKTPLLNVELERGSYRLRICSPGRRDVAYPVHIERDGIWDGFAPGEKEPFPIYLPGEEELGVDDVYVPAGYAWIGGVPGAVEPLARQRVWLDAFVLRRFPVTNAEYIAFLNDLVEQGREAEALRYCPRPQITMPQAADELLYTRDDTGHFHVTVVPGDSSGNAWQLDWPVVLIDWFAATAFARWYAARTGLPWRLPHEVEREKAARGADGRLFPWGNHFDPNWACVIDSYVGSPSRVGVNEYPQDESPYGIRGLAGNSRDWCANVWTVGGPDLASGRLSLGSGELATGELQAARGGCWGSHSDLSRMDARFASRPGTRWRTTGIRLARLIIYP